MPVAYLGFIHEGELYKDFNRHIQYIYLLSILPKYIT